MTRVGKGLKTRAERGRHTPHNYESTPVAPLRHVGIISNLYQGSLSLPPLANSLAGKVETVASANVIYGRLVPHHGGSVPRGGESVYQTNDLSTRALLFLLFLKKK